MKNDMSNIEEENIGYAHSELEKEEILERLRQGGYRITRQRMALLEVILESECSCCKEIYFQVHKKMPRIGIATIYRMINTLEEVGAIQRKNIYQICSSNKFRVEDCIVEYSSGVQVSLSGEKLHQVVEEGIKNLGLAREKSISQIIALGQQ